MNLAPFVNWRLVLALIISVYLIKFERTYVVTVYGLIDLINMINLIEFSAAE